MFVIFWIYAIQNRGAPGDSDPTLPQNKRLKALSTPLRKMVSRIASAWVVVRRAAHCWLLSVCVRLILFTAPCLEVCCPSNVLAS